MPFSYLPDPPPPAAAGAGTGGTSPDSSQATSRAWSLWDRANAFAVFSVARYWSMRLRSLALGAARASRSLLIPLVPVVAVAPVVPVRATFPKDPIGKATCGEREGE